MAANKKILRGGFDFEGGKSRPLFVSKSATDGHAESQHQIAFFEWCLLSERENPVLKWFFHVPNGEARERIPYTRRDGKKGYYSPAGAKLKRMGLKPGVLDVFHLSGRNGHAGLVLEFKAGRNDLTKEQREWKAYLESEGYDVRVVRSWMEAARAAVEYFGLERHAAIPKV